MSTDHAYAIGLPERLRLIRDGMINCSGFFVTAVVGFILVPVMLNKLGAEAYGLWLATLAIAGILGAFDFGLGSSVTREVAAAQGGKAKEDAQKFVVFVGQLYLAFGAAGFFLISLLYIPLSKGLNLSEDAQKIAPAIFSFCGIAFCGDQLVLFASAVLGGLRRFKTINYLSVITTFLRATGIIGLLIGGATLPSVAAWHALVSLAAALVALSLLKHIEPGYGLCLFRFERMRIRGYVPFAFGSMLTTVAGSLVWTVSPLVIGVVNGPAWVAWYHIGQKFPLALSGVYKPISNVFFSVASEYDQRGTMAATQELIEVGTRWITALVLPVCLVFWIVAPQLLGAWVGQVRPDTTTVLRITTVAVGADAIGAIALQVLWGQGAVYKVLAVLSFMTVTNVGFSVLLLPVLGITGAAWALCVSLILGSLILHHLAAKMCGASRLALLRSVIAGIWFPLLICGGTAATIKTFFASDRWWEIVPLASTSLLAYGAAFYWIGARDEERAMVHHACDLGVNLAISTHRLMRNGLRQISFLRSGWYLIATLILRRRQKAESNREIFDSEYVCRIDAWGYNTAWGKKHLEVTEQLLDRVRNSRPFLRAFEIGCGEGMVTKTVAPRCSSLLATDISGVALERARERCRHLDQVHFAEWDLLKDPQLGIFDLVLTMGVLEVFLAHKDLHVARTKIIDSLAPNGYLLVTSTKQHPVVENAWWGRWLIRGSQHINAFLLASGHLDLCGRHETESHLLTIYRKAY
jgi:O-antigen/teichoic acid export membrane protein/2-polyprenyl-3-methyl-5-hydroxy-6-metoxy-1,4-benzoquinol methylase